VQLLSRTQIRPSLGRIVERGGGKEGVSEGGREEFDRKFYDYCSAELVEMLRKFAALMRGGDGEGKGEEEGK